MIKFKTFLKAIKPLFYFSYQFVQFIIKQLMALIYSGPYVVYKLIFPKRRRPYRSHPFSKILRQILEFKKARKYIGVNLAIVFIFFAFVHNPLIAKEDYFSLGRQEISKLQSTYVLNTDHIFRSPVPGYISQRFSWFHPGIDIAGNDNRLIYPIAPGKVVLIENSNWGYGKSVVIDHGDNMFSRYAHLLYIDVVINQEVNHQSVIGAIGSTGRSTGPHLHLEIHQNGEVLDPLAFIPDQEYQNNYIDLSVPLTEKGLIKINTQDPIIATPSINQQKTVSFEASISATPEKQVADGFDETQIY